MKFAIKREFNQPSRTDTWYDNLQTYLHQNEISAHAS